MILPKGMLDAGQVMLNMAGVITVIAYVNPVFLMPILLIGFIVIFIRGAFLKVSKCIKYLEANGEL